MQVATEHEVVVAAFAEVEEQAVEGAAVGPGPLREALPGTLPPLSVLAAILQLAVRVAGSPAAAEVSAYPLPELLARPRRKPRFGADELPRTLSSAHPSSSADRPRRPMNCLLSGRLGSGPAERIGATCLPCAGPSPPSMARPDPADMPHCRRSQNASVERAPRVPLRLRLRRRLLRHRRRKVQGATTFHRSGLVPNRGRLVSVVAHGGAAPA